MKTKCWANRGQAAKWAEAGPDIDWDAGRDCKDSGCHPNLSMMANIDFNNESSILLKI